MTTSVTGEDALCRLSAVEARRRFADGTVSPVALMDAVLDRAARMDPVLRLFAHTMFDEARQEARQAETALRAGAACGPLHGIPVTIKDNIAVAAIPMRAGSAALPATMPAKDGLTVRRIRAAGGIVIGKTTLPEFAHKVLTDNAIDGDTRNPWNLDHTPGGSSGGASAALAAGAGPLGMGTDGGGSIRCPASCTSTVGLKPTLGRVPNETAPDAFGSFFFVGPMARTVADVRLLLSLIEGPCDDDPYSGLPPAPPRQSGLIRIGFVEHFGDYRTDDAVAGVVRRAVECLSEGGAVVQAMRPACFFNLFPSYQILATTAHAARFGHLADSASHLLTTSMRQSIEIGRGWSGVDVLVAQDRRTTLFRAVQALFAEVDVLATPTMIAPPPGLGSGGSIATKEFGAWAAPLYPFNMTGHPAISVPAGFSPQGLPVGLQLVGRWHADAMLLDLAETLETALSLPQMGALPS